MHHHEPRRALRSMQGRSLGGLLATTSVIAALLVGLQVSPATADTTVADGEFVSTGTDTYRIAGGAPVHLESWDALGGPQPTTPVTQTELDAMPASPSDGTFLVGAPSGEVYRVAGGAPVYVSDWAAFGGQQHAVTVDDAAIAHAGQAGPWSHLLAVPKDGTYVRGTVEPRLYLVRDGHLTATERQIGGVVVDEAAIVNAGTGGVWDHLLTAVLSNPVFAPVPAALPPQLGAPPTAPPTALGSAPAPRASLRVSIRHRGHAIRAGRLCLATTRTALVRRHATSAGPCVPVAARGATAVTPTRPGTYFLLHVGAGRHVSTTRFALGESGGAAVVWRW